MTLGDAATLQVATYAIIFCRVGAAMMFLPGFGDTAVNTRTRLLLAFAVTFAMGSVFGDGSHLTAGFWPSVTAVMSEVMVGLFIGIAGRLTILALQSAGSIIAAQISLSNAMSTDPVTAQQAALPANFMTMVGVTLIFVTDLHHVLLAGIAHSYATFPIAAAPQWGGFAEAITTIVSEGFSIALALAAPFILVGITVSLGMGLLARLMPQVQVFFIIMPLQITIGLGLMGLTLSAGMHWYLGKFVALQSYALGGG